MSKVFRVVLQGSQEVPARSTAASGVGTVVFDSNARTAAYTLRVQGIDFGPLLGSAPTPNALDDLTSMHVHNAPRRDNGPVVFGQFNPAQDGDDLQIALNGDGSVTVSGVWETTDPANQSLNVFAGILQATPIGADAPLYFNVHTVQFPGGEIRGQWVAIAGDGADKFNGTAGPDYLPGLGSADTIRGLGGDDFIDGGRGNDRLAGNAGDDTIYGGSGSDTLTGDEGDDRLYGGGGHDRIDGGAGRDDIDGGSGHDTLTGGDGDDWIVGGSGNDRVYGDDGDDVLFGGNGHDIMRGGDGHDHVEGGAGDDTIDGGLGYDRLFGGAGNDKIVDTEGFDGNALYGDAGNDTLVAGAGPDWLEGGSGVDVLTGGKGNDVLFGGSSIFQGGVLTGGTKDGAYDRFIFHTGDGHDSIYGFELGIDRVDLSRFDVRYTAFAQLNIYDVGGGALIAFDEDNSVLLWGVSSGLLSRGDFIL